MLTVALLVAICLNLAQSASGVTCQSGWTKIGSACYKGFETRLYWDIAQKECKKLGSNLATVQNTEQARLIRDLGGGRPWIGLASWDAGTSWEWVDGTNFTCEEWHRDEPDQKCNLDGSGECCVYLPWNTGAWANIACGGGDFWGGVTGYVCMLGEPDTTCPKCVRDASKNICLDDQCQSTGASSACLVDGVADPGCCAYAGYGSCKPGFRYNSSGEVCHAEGLYDSRGASISSCCVPIDDKCPSDRNPAKCLNGGKEDPSCCAMKGQGSCSYGFSFSAGEECNENGGISSCCTPNGECIRDEFLEDNDCFNQHCPSNADYKVCWSGDFKIKDCCAMEGQGSCNYGFFFNSSGKQCRSDGAVTGCCTPREDKCPSDRDMNVCLDGQVSDPHCCAKEGQGGCTFGYRFNSSGVSCNSKGGIASCCVPTGECIPASDGKNNCFSEHCSKGDLSACLENGQYDNDCCAMEDAGSCKPGFHFNSSGKKCHSNGALSSCCTPIDDKCPSNRNINVCLDGGQEDLSCCAKKGQGSCKPGYSFKSSGEVCNSNGAIASCCVPDGTKVDDKDNDATPTATPTIECTSNMANTCLNDHCDSKQDSGACLERGGDDNDCCALQDEGSCKAGFRLKFSGKKCHSNGAVSTCCIPEQQAVSPCKAGWTKVGGACYKVFTASISWSAAKEKCEGFNSKLATVHSEEQGRLVKGLAGGTKPYIGLKSSDGGKKWKWVDGTVSTCGTWHQYEPDVECEVNGGGQCCASLVSVDGRWANVPCAQNQWTDGYACMIGEPESGCTSSTSGGSSSGTGESVVAAEQAIAAEEAADTTMIVIIGGIVAVLLVIAIAVGGIIACICCCRSKGGSMPATNPIAQTFGQQSVSVQVPAGASAGQELKVTDPRTQQTFVAIIPPQMRPGDTFEVPLPNFQPIVGEPVIGAPMVVRAQVAQPYSGEKGESPDKPPQFSKV